MNPRIYADPVHEERLVGGHADGSVVRVDGTVRKPFTESTRFVTEFMDAVRARGVDLPQRYGLDEQGHVIQEYIRAHWRSTPVPGANPA